MRNYCHCSYRRAEAFSRCPACGHVHLVRGNHAAQSVSAPEPAKEARPAKPVPLWRQAFKRGKVTRKLPSRITKQRVLERDRVCVCCGAQDGLTVDHLIPRMWGGCNAEWNLVAMCFDCNQKKGSRLLKKWVDLAHAQRLAFAGHLK